MKLKVPMIIANMLIALPFFYLIVMGSANEVRRTEGTSIGIRERTHPVPFLYF